MNEYADLLQATISLIAAHSKYYASLSSDEDFGTINYEQARQMRLPLRASYLAACDDYEAAFNALDIRGHVELARARRMAR